jgi:carboxypeptidase C (cathepsin A)
MTKYLSLAIAALLATAAYCAPKGDEVHALPDTGPL